MITVCFHCNHGLYSGFCVKGHADYADLGQDIVCAAVSSAALMTANAITDVLGCGAVSRSRAGRLTLAGCSGDERAQAMLEGLYIHLCALAKQYPEHLDVGKSALKRR